MMADREAKKFVSQDDRMLGGYQKKLIADSS
jgi:hypothetical protein